MAEAAAERYEMALGADRPTCGAAVIGSRHELGTKDKRVSATYYFSCRENGNRWELLAVITTGGIGACSTVLSFDPSERAVGDVAIRAIDGDRASDRLKRSAADESGEPVCRLSMDLG
ncbi:MAG: hypothetical protein KDI19_11430 [Pseudomonadales bacterium]|nr:hypothetical protein [Pseudomonadales bacterium]